jgi:hypothetical protein
LQFSYKQPNCEVGEKCFTYEALMDASAQTLMMRRGWGIWDGSGFRAPLNEQGEPLSRNPITGKPTLAWLGKPQPQPITGTCASLRVLGGDQEAGFPKEQCADAIREAAGSSKTVESVSMALGMFFNLDLTLSALYLLVRQPKSVFPLTRGIARVGWSTALRSGAWLSATAAAEGGAAIVGGKLLAALGVGLAVGVGLEKTQQAVFGTSISDKLGDWLFETYGPADDSTIEWFDKWFGWLP